MSAMPWNFFGNQKVEVIASAKENCGRRANSKELMNEAQAVRNSVNGERSNNNNSHLKSSQDDSSGDEYEENDLDGYEFDEEDEEADIDNDSCPSPDEMYATSCTSPLPVGDENSGNCDDGKGDKDYGSSFRGHPLLENPILQLQSALGMKLKEMNGCQSNAISSSLFNGVLSNQSAGNSSLSQFSTDDNITGEIYRCHLCSYTGNSQQHFNLHMNTHFDHKCPFCDYTSRTEGRLKKHIRDFHSEVPPDSWAGTRVPRNSDCTNDASVNSDGGSTGDRTVGSNGSGKSRKYKCKQCNFIAISKSDFWEHSKGHIKAEKLLTCPKCQFVTEYKHHLEYHLRNHFGSKPFKCAKCNYSCVNKSMLNSHMKSHSNIYQYRCNDCSYATKYCHSLKLHLRKYSHKPATVLNLDGTPNPYPIIDVYGTRRGPRPKKRPKSKSPVKDTQPKTSTPPASANSEYPLLPNTVSAINFLENPATLPPLIPSSIPMGLPFLYPPLFPNGLLGSPALANVSSPSAVLFPPSIPHPFSSLPDTPKSMYSPATAASEDANESNCKSSKDEKRHSNGSHVVPLKCSFCDFTTEVRELYGKHLVLHVANENEETPKMHNTSLKSAVNFTSHSEIEEQQKALFNELMARQSSSPNSRRLLEQITSNPVAANVLFSGCSNLSRPEVTQLSPPPKAMEIQETTSNASGEASSNDHRPISAPVDLNADLRELFSPPPRAKSSPCLFTPSLAFAERNEELPAVSKLMISMNDDASPLDLSSNRSTPPTLSMQTNDKKRLNAINDSLHKDQEQLRHNRRKGKAVKLDRMCIKIQESVSSKEKQSETKWKEHICTFCDIAFKDIVMYSMHMAYHGYCDPFTCKMCGHRSSDKVSFFLHIARTAHM